MVKPAVDEWVITAWTDGYPVEEVVEKGGVALTRKQGYEVEVDKVHEMHGKPAQGESTQWDE